MFQACLSDCPCHSFVLVCTLGCLILPHPAVDVFQVLLLAPALRCFASDCVSISCSVLRVVVALHARLGTQVSCAAFFAAATCALLLDFLFAGRIANVNYRRPDLSWIYRVYCSLPRHIAHPGVLAVGGSQMAHHCRGWRILRRTLSLTPICVSIAISLLPPGIISID